MAKNFPPLNSATHDIGTLEDQAEQSHNSGDSKVFTPATSKPLQSPP